MSKEAVIKYLQTDRSLMGGRNLYNKLPNKSLALQGSFSRMPNSPANLGRLHYELCMAVGITERQLTIFLQKPVQAETETQQAPPPPPVDLTPEERLMAFKREEVDYFTANTLLSELGIKAKSRKKEDVYNALEAVRQERITAKVTELPIEIKAAVKLRDQFPFLREDTCPDALKILVNDLITSYEAFKEAQPKLHELLSEADAKAMVDVVLENYIKNKEAWAELEHYKTTGNVLGAHPLFARLEAKKEITELPTADLAKKIKNLEINIGKNKTKNNMDLVARDEELLLHAKKVLAKR